MAERTTMPERRKGPIPAPQGSAEGLAEEAVPASRVSPLGLPSRDSGGFGGRLSPDPLYGTDRFRLVAPYTDSGGVPAS